MVVAGTGQGVSSGGPIADVAFAQVNVAGVGRPAPVLDLLHRRRHALPALLPVLVADALCQRLHPPRRPHPVLPRPPAAGERAQRSVAHAGDLGRGGGGAALLVDEPRVGLAEKGVVGVAEEAALELDAGASGGGAEGGEAVEGGTDAGGAVGDGEVGAALEEAVGGGSGGCSCGGGVVVGREGGGVGESGEEGVDVELVGGADGVPVLRAANVDEGSEVVKGRHGCRLHGRKQEEEEVEEELE